MVAGWVRSGWLATATLMFLVACAPLPPATPEPLPPPQTVAAQEVPSNQWKDVELISLLVRHGFREPQVLDRGLIRFRAEDRVMLLFGDSDGSLHLRWYANGVQCPSVAPNLWNRTRQHVRAFLDNQGDPVLAADLLPAELKDAGQVSGFILLFDRAVADYRLFLLEKCH